MRQGQGTAVPSYAQWERIVTDDIFPGRSQFFATGSPVHSFAMMRSGPGDAATGRLGPEAVDSVILDGAASEDVVVAVMRARARSCGCGFPAPTGSSSESTPSSSAAAA